MLNKFQQGKDLLKMRQQAKALQRELEQITETVEEGDLEVKVSGDQKVIYIKVDGEDKGDIVDVLNKAMKRVQKKAAKKMLEMGGGLSGLLGG
jgi:DNA-binding protein YbaB